MNGNDLRNHRVGPARCRRTICAGAAMKSEIIRHDLQIMAARFG
jgi:hypothetical protein